ncbi:hypothetical protein UA32_17235 [Photobacterium angustum]|uniref:Uncharacterized protein n=2 Tax=Photobacterium angustum TaxID=661 RepID=A0ABX5H4Z7_PHOAN|nr:hypothetical protein UA32_17235 [Photobacterium angustum]PSX10940.1 hypothetical protein C0W27_09925 [Photobacterium angustum]
MKLMTFRSECICGTATIPAFLSKLGVKIHKVDIANEPSTKAKQRMGEKDVYTIEVQDNHTLESLRELMTKEIEQEGMFLNLHKCYQTLNLGMSPDERHFNS